MSTKVYVVLLTQFEEAYGPEYYCEDKFFGVYASRLDAMDAIRKDCDEYIGGCSWIKLIYDSDNSVTLVNEWDDTEVAQYDILEQRLS